MRIIKILFIFFVLLSLGCNITEPDVTSERKNILQSLVNSKESLHEFSNLFNKVDRNFYGGYRIKPKKFYFFYLKNDQFLESFQFDQFNTDSIIRKTNDVGIEEVLSKENENFYRLKVFKGGMKKCEIFLAKNTDSLISKSINFSDITVVSNIYQIDMLFGKNFLFKIDDSIFVYFQYK